jgi:two-component system CheB/CheR fusion protein
MSEPSPLPPTSPALDPQDLLAENRALREVIDSLREESREALRQTQKQNEFLARIIRAASQPVAVGYADGRLGLVNRAFEELTGYSAGELQAVGWVALTPEEWRQMERDLLAEQRRTRLPIRYEKEYVRKDGTRVPIELLVHLVTDAVGEPEYYYSFVTDISVRKRVEAELRSITSNIPDIIARFDRAQRYVFINDSVTAATGRPPSDFIGHTLRELGIPLSLCEMWDAAIAKVFASGETQVRQFEYESIAGPRRYEVKFVPERRADGVVEHVLGVTSDVTTAWHAAQELARARDAAETASAAKDHFLAVLSHELRTPLAPVRLALSMWEADAGALPPRVREELAMVRRNVDLECRLIDDMLDLNRIAKGKLDLQLGRIDLHEELRHALRTVAPEAESKGIELRQELGARRPHVMADAARLQQVLWNVLKNAVKFTPSGGSVTVQTLDAPNGRARVAVRDTGAGIDPEAIARIFHPFEQASELVTRQFGGLGLGLAISRAIVEMHGGTLRAHSDGPGKGSTFELDLASADGPLPATPATPARATDGSNGDARRLRILIVEDHKDTAHIMRRLLGSFGYEVEIVGSVAEALAAWHPGRFDVVISDIGLPDGSGHDLMRSLAAAGPTVGIALTGYGMEEDIRAGSDAGFAAYLTKPVSIEQLELTIRRVMATATAGPSSH